jgi:L,D-peptidoglycan transpeptidase YkuD (ErfK/YbiS/YcfS/YnhG family)
MTLRVDTASCVLTAFGRAHRVAIGKGGAVPAAAKREGDGATPLGNWTIDGLLIRPDRMAAPATALPWRWLRPSDGWCDAVGDAAYNRPVAHPYPNSAEQLWRMDHAYDLVLVLGHNQRPVEQGKGSAIFWHVAQPDWRPTEGCIAMELQALANLVPHLAPGMVLEVV